MKLFKKLLTTTIVLGLTTPLVMGGNFASAFTGTITTNQCFQNISIENTAVHNVTYIELNSNRQQNYFIWGNPITPGSDSAYYDISNDPFTEENDFITPKIEYADFKLSRGEPFQFCMNDETITYETAGTADNPTLVRKH